MRFFNFVWIVFFAKSLLSAPESSQATHSLIHYPPVAPDVSFRAVTQLDAKQPDRKYSYGDSEFQFAELWLPNHKTDELSPLVILIHGGCWLNAFDLKHTYAMSTALAQAGYAVWSLEYRRSGDKGGGWPGSFDDIKNGIEYLEQVKVPGVDKQKIVVMGHSAGGHLALWYGAQWLAENTETKKLKVNGILGLAAIVDIEAYAKGTNSCQTATPRFMGGPPERFANRYAMANPAKLKLPDTVRLIHGTQDRLVPIEQAKNAQLPIKWSEGAGHFDLIHPGTPAWQEIMIQLNGLLE